jgi:hypothetical protein
MQIHLNWVALSNVHDDMLLELDLDVANTCILRSQISQSTFSLKTRPLTIQFHVERHCQVAKCNAYCNIEVIHNIA